MKSPAEVAAELVRMALAAKGNRWRISEKTVSVLAEIGVHEDSLLHFSWLHVLASELAYHRWAFVHLVRGGFAMIRIDTLEGAPILPS